MIKDIELGMMQDIGDILDMANAKPEEIVTIKICVRRKYLDEASKKLLKLVSENDWL